MNTTSEWQAESYVKVSGLYPKKSALQAVYMFVWAKAKVISVKIFDFSGVTF